MGPSEFPLNGVQPQMTISRRLMIITLLTVLEVSMTIWAVFEISKGARFHQLNFLHLESNLAMQDAVDKLTLSGQIDTANLKSLIKGVRQHPVECIEQINFVNRLFMRMIGTDKAIAICHKDIADANHALAAVELFDGGGSTAELLIAELRNTSLEFSANSDAFEKPITQTVSALVQTLIPLVVLLSVFNIVTILYLSRKIHHSIRDVIDLLSDESSNASLDEEIEKRVFGELKDLLHAAKNRIQRDWINKEMNVELESLVQKRTVALVQANDELSQFAYRASHDLKAPLTTVKGLSAIVRMDIEDGDLAEAVKNSEKISDQMIRLETLVVDIMNLAQADVGEVASDIVNIPELIQEIQDRQTMMIEDADVTFHVTMDSSLYVQTSRTRLIQIIENLVVNAIKYRNVSQSDCFIKLSAKHSLDEIEITIEDNGIGIPAEFKEDVFNMFNRFHPGVSNGSGLGLSIVKKHIDKIGAKIGFETSSHGTVFTVTLPTKLENQT